MLCKTCDKVKEQEDLTVCNACMETSKRDFFTKMEYITTAFSMYHQYETWMEDYLCQKRQLMII
jgi:hypothetical protein